MSDIDLDALEATARAATPGPWHYDPEDGGIDRLEDDEGEIVAAGRVVGTFWPHGGPMRRLLLESQDAEHIATFDPPTALALIARLREAEAVIEEVRANAVELLDADDDSYDGSLSAIWAVELIDAYKTTKTEDRSEP